jgi:hypothetical protein
VGDVKSEKGDPVTRQTKARNEASKKEERNPREV